MKTIIGAAGLAWAVALAGAQDGDGFRPIFDGATLAGWKTPDPSYWTVEEGAITGRITAEHPCATNQYLVWEGGELADFELVLKSRLRGQGGINNGFQFRSRVLPDHDVCGYQMDNNLETPWLARLYDEYGRHTLAWRGERATFDAEGKRTVAPIAEAGGAAWFKLEEWHEYRLRCVGRKITLQVDGRLAAEVEDNDARRFEPQGILALQLHSGPPTVVQFKEIRLKILKPAEERAARISSPGREALRRAAAGWWELDSGGHGAEPALRHIPAFDRFELNVDAAGPKARPGGKVVLMHGAHFETAGALNLGGGELTIFLRGRDPSGAWNAALMNKEGFRLFGDGQAISFAVRTDQGEAVASFPISKIDAKAWHNVAGRYNGSAVALFCNGELMAEKPLRGRIAHDGEPLRIAAEAQGGKMGRHFEGELEEAAVWTRALAAEEIAGLEL